MRKVTEPMRVLLIDDDELSREILGVQLGGENHEVVPVGSGDEAVALLRSGLGVDVVLSDLQMPGLAGAELGAALRAAWAGMSRAARPLALLAMSGSEPAFGATAGYDGFLLKPFTMEQFADAVWRLEGGAEQGMAAELRGAEEGLTAEVLDEEKLRVLQRTFRPEQMKELFCFALADAERQMEVMEGARAEGDDALYRRCAHSMKGSFGMLGAPELRALAGAAEEGGLDGLATKVTKDELFLGALGRLRHTLVARGICHS